MNMHEKKNLTSKKALSADNDVIHVLRSTHSNQAGLVALADQKANVIIGMVAVTLTLLFTNTVFLKTLSQPLVFLLLLCVFAELLALFFALVVILPITVDKKRTDSIDEISNPLFFGFFVHQKQNDYINYIIENIDNNLSARQHMAKDIYQTGLVLKRKYKYLKFAYTLAASGIVALVFLGIVSIFLT